MDGREGSFVQIQVGTPTAVPIHQRGRMWLYHLRVRRSTGERGWKDEGREESAVCRDREGGMLTPKEYKARWVLWVLWAMMYSPVKSQLAGWLAG